MPRKLTVVTAETPQPVKKAPTSIKAAAGLSERDLLVTMRDTAATVIDVGGVPAHALAGIMRQIRDLDKEIRAIDARAAEDEATAAQSEVGDGQFDASAV